MVVSSADDSCRSVKLIMLLHPGKGAEYCDQPICLCVCLCVCLSASISLEPLDRSARNFVCSSDSVVLRRRCVTLCSSGDMDDVTFGRNGRDAGR